MHEFSVVSQIVPVILEKAQEAGALKVLRVDMEIGELTFLVEEQLKYAFEMLFTGTPAEGAEIRFTTIRAAVECSKCGYRGGVEAVDTGIMRVPVLMCPTCREPAEPVSGKEFNVRDIQVELPDK